MSALRGFTHLPPKSCIPSRANTTIKRKRRKSRLMMDFMELMRDTTRFLREAQYLTERDITLLQDPVKKTKTKHTHTHTMQAWFSLSSMNFMLSYLLGDLENSQKSQRSQYTYPKWHARSEEAPDHFKDAANNHLQKMPGWKCAAFDWQRAGQTQLSGVNRSWCVRFGHVFVIGFSNLYGSVLNCNVFLGDIKQKCVQST